MNIITVGDIERIQNVFDEKIEKLEKEIAKNPDLEIKLKREIEAYKETLDKYIQYHGDEDTSQYFSRK